MYREPQGNSCSQPAPQVGNMYGRRRNAVPVDRGFGSVTWRTESGSSHSTSTLVAESGSSHGTHLSGRSFSPPQIIRCLPSRPTKLPRRSTLQTMAYTEHWGETDAPPQIETVRLSDDSSDEYQNSRTSDQTESDTELDAEDNDILDDDMAPGTHRRSRTAERGEAKSQVSTARVSTTPDWRGQRQSGAPQLLHDV